MMAELDWDDLLNSETPDESTGPTWEDLPPDTWAVGDIETNPDLDWAKPVVRQASGEKGKFYILEATLRCTGGAEGVVEEKHQGRSVRISAFLHPGPKEKNPGILSSRAKGLLNALLSQGVGGPVIKGKDKLDEKEARATERIKSTYAVLNAAAKKHNLSLDQFGGDKALFLGSCAVHELRERNKVRSLVFKTKGETSKKDNKVYIKAGAFMDATDANMTDNGISKFSAAQVTF